MKKYADIEVENSLCGAECESWGSVQFIGVEEPILWWSLKNWLGKGYVDVKLLRKHFIYYV